MTISNPTNIVTYNGDSATQAFPVFFYFLANSHLRVTSILIATGLRTLLVEGVDYTATGAGNQLGGFVTTTGTFTNAYQIEIKRVVPMVQADNYVANDTLPSETVEKDFDYAMMVAQQLDQRLSLIEASGAGLGINIVNLAGSGVGLFASQVGNVYNLKKIVGLGGVTIADAGTEVDISITGALQAANNLSDVAAQQTALNNLTNVAGGTNEYVLTKDTASGNALWKVATASLTPPGNTYQILRGDGAWASEIKNAFSLGPFGGAAALVISDSTNVPGVWINQTGAAANTRLYRLGVNSSGQFHIALFNDDGATGFHFPFTINRSGSVPTFITLLGDGGRLLVGPVADDGASLVQVGGSMRFDGNSRVLQADTQNATLANRFVFQDSTVNSSTSFNIVPNGTSVISNTKAHNAASITNAAFVSTSISNTVALINSGHNGAGTTLPFNLSIDGNASVQITAPGGRVLVGPGTLPTDDTTSALQINGNINIFPNGALFKANLSDATLANRFAFTTNVANSNAGIVVAPSGTGNTGFMQVFNNSNLAAAGCLGDFRVGAAFVSMNSTPINGGTTLPVRIVVNGVVGLTCDLSGNTFFTHAQADQSYSLQVPITGFTITIGNNISTLLLNPAGTLATGTITMPATPIDGQIVRLATTQTITALTLNANAGQTISGNVATLTAAAPATYMYNLSGTKWYHIQ